MLRQIELDLNAGSDVASACRKSVVSDATYCTWSKRYVSSDNGKEFTAKALQDWLTKVGITPIQIYPGSPWENGDNERFNGTLRTEIHNTEWFSSIKQAKLVIGKSLRQYTHIRPHQALNMRLRVPETLRASGP
ncbi:MAG: integrase core domain-containing protein [Rhodospirillaceae bacterium]